MPSLLPSAGSLSIQFTEVQVLWTMEFLVTLEKNLMEMFQLKDIISALKCHSVLILLIVLAVSPVTGKYLLCLGLN